MLQSVVSSVVDDGEKRGRERRIAIREKGMKKVSVRDAMQIPNDTRGRDSDNKDVKLLTAHFESE